MGLRLVRPADRLSDPDDPFGDIAGRQLDFDAAGLISEPACSISLHTGRCYRRGGLLTTVDPMADNERETLGSPTPEPDAGLNRDPEDWVTGDEPMTAAQRSYLDTLAREAGEELPADLTKAEASEHIDRLQKGSNRLGKEQ